MKLSLKRAIELARQISHNTSNDLELELAECFEECAGEDGLTAWLKAQRRKDEVVGQVLWRAASAAYAHVDVGPSVDFPVKLVCGFPLYAAGTLPFEKLRAEIAGWCREQHGLSAGQARLSARPIRADVVISWEPWEVRGLLVDEDAEAEESNEPIEPAPMIWPVVFELSSEQALRLQKGLVRVGQPSLSFHAIAHRCAQWVEYKQPNNKFKLYPLCSWANVHFMAQVVALRTWLAVTRPTDPLRANFVEGLLTLGLPGGHADKTFDFGAASTSDVLTLLENVQKSSRSKYQFEWANR